MTQPYAEDAARDATVSTEEQPSQAGTQSSEGFSAEEIEDIVERAVSRARTADREENARNYRGIQAQVDRLVNAVKDTQGDTRHSRALLDRIAANNLSEADIKEIQAAQREANIAEREAAVAAAKETPPADAPDLETERAKAKDYGEFIGRENSLKRYAKANKVPWTAELHDLAMQTVRPSRGDAGWDAWQDILEAKIDERARALDPDRNVPAPEVPTTRGNGGGAGNPMAIYAAYGRGERPYDAQVQAAEKALGF